MSNHTHRILAIQGHAELTVSADHLAVVHSMSKEPLKVVAYRHGKVVGSYALTAGESQSVHPRADRIQIIGSGSCTLTTAERPKPLSYPTGTGATPLAKGSKAAQRYQQILQNEGPAKAAEWLKSQAQGAGEVV